MDYYYVNGLRVSREKWEKVKDNSSYSHIDIQDGEDRIRSAMSFWFTFKMDARFGWVIVLGFMLFLVLTVLILGG